LGALTAAGLRVAVLQLESFRDVYLKRQPLCAPVQDLINAGVVGRVERHERVEAGLVLVRQAAVLQFANTAAECRVRGRRTVVVADRAPARADGSDRRYRPADCTATAVRLFGADPEWVPQDPGVRAALRTVDAALVLAERDHPTAVASPGWVEQRTGARSGPVVAGTDLCDAASWPPDVAETLAACRRLPDADIRVRLPDRPRADFTVDLPRRWLGFEAADLGTRPFLHQLDFYLHFPPPSAAEWHSRPALEAAAMGCVVVMPERYAALYGDAAVYCGRSEVAPLIARHRADPALFAEQSRRARSVIARAHDPALLVERILEFLPVTAAATAALPMV
jgi:hypothetical protein